MPLKLLFLALPIAAQNTYTRLDRKSLFEDAFEAKNLTSIPGKQNIDAIPMDDGFVITSKCLVNDTAMCDSITRGINNVSKKLSSQLFIIQPVNVDVTIGPICPDPNTCTYKNFLAYAQSSAMFSITNSFNTVLYPQALVKQVSASVLEYTSSDIMIMVDSTRNWYFKEKGGAIDKSQFDLEYSAAHQLLHGLGFQSNLNFVLNGTTFDGKVVNVDPGDLQRVYFTPNNGLQIFDFFVSSNSKDVGLSANRNIYFNTAKGSLLLSNPDAFVPGSGFSHFGPGVENTPDALMLPVLGSGFSSDVVLGPNTLDVLQTIGWPIRNRTLPSKLMLDKPAGVKSFGVSAGCGLSILSLLSIYFI